MEPVLSIDDLVFTKQTETIKVGDIISYRDENGKKVMHRIVKIIGNDIITKGDANNTIDKAIKKDQIVGVYVGRIKYVGKALRFIKTPMGITLYTLIILILLLLPNHKNKLGEDGTSKKETMINKRLTNILFLKIIYIIFVIGSIKIGNYAKYQTQLEGSSNITVAKWDVSIAGQDNIKLPTISIGNSNTYQSYNLSVTSKSETAVNYTVIISKVPDGVLIQVDDKDPCIENNNIIIIENLGSFTAGDLNHTRNHKFTIIVPEGITPFENQELDIDVIFNQIN